MTPLERAVAAARELESSPISRAVKLATQELESSSIARAVELAARQREASAIAIARATELATKTNELSISAVTRAVLQHQTWELQNSNALRLAEVKNSEALRLGVEYPNAEALRWAREYPGASMLAASQIAQEAQIGRLVNDLQHLPELASVQRAERWATQLGATGVLATLGSAPNEVDRIQSIATSILNLRSGLERLNMMGATGQAHQIEATRLKLATLAGSSDVLGFDAKTSVAAYQSLFGEWHTRPDLPQPFWQDAAVRRRHYLDAAVDPGLIDATPTAAVEVVVESGFAAGISTGGESVAMFNIAGLSMQIRSSDVMVDSFRAINAFEQELRRFIGEKLREVAGPQWFKQRVHGATVKKARENRETALANGETETELISFLDLGDLAAIILRNDNWNGVFGHVFPNRERLDYDFQALVATRRPTMHARNIDGVRLVEMMCIIERLSNWIKGDGQWKRIADSD